MHTHPFTASAEALPPAIAPVPPARATRAELAGLTALTAAGIGAAGDVLLRGGPPGVGATLLVYSLVGAVAALAARAGRLDSQARALLLVAAVFGSGFALRASAALTLLNALALGSVLVVLMACMGSRGRWSVRGTRFRDLGRAALYSAAYGTFGAPLLAADARQGTARRPGRILGPVDVGVAMRALALTAPVLLLFTALLTSADPAFEQLVGSAFDFEFGAIAGHVLVTCAIAWPVAGYLRGALVAPRAWRGGARPLLPRLGIAEVAVALGSLDALFLAFVAVQLRYLFGGNAGLRVAGLSYAEYARRGFFELVLVVALVLPVLLVARELLGRATPRAERVYRALGGTTLVLVLMIVASAMQRMWMYQVEFGLTELRLYTSAFMGWVVAVLGLFALTVLQGRKRGLAFGALSSGWATVLALNVVNPDALIVRVNAEREAHGHPFDAGYAAGLSDDAVPALAALLPSVHGLPRCELASRLAWPSGRAEHDWRSWNLGRARAQSVSTQPAVATSLARCRRLWGVIVPPAVVRTR